jgi:hypothetical protein
MADPAIPQLSSVTSESLQATIRRLLPSQQGFGAELAATNVITPIIDLTAAAEGFELQFSLQHAYAFGNMNNFSVTNGNPTLINTAGFWVVRGISNIKTSASSILKNNFTMNDGSSQVTFWQHQAQNNSSSANDTLQFDFYIFLRVGDTLEASSNGATANLFGNSHQVADVNGNLTVPSGFSPQ